MPNMPAPPQTTAPPAPAAPAPAAPLPVLTQQLMGIMDEMIQLMEEERPVIAKSNTTRHGEIIKRKQELAVDYQAALQSLAGQKNVPESEKNKLREKGKALNAIAHKNAEMIRLTHAATERLLKAMMHNIRRDLHQTTTYSPRGNFTMAERDQSGPVAYNRTL